MAFYGFVGPTGPGVINEHLENGASPIVAKLVVSFHRVIHWIFGLWPIQRQQ